MAAPAVDVAAAVGTKPVDAVEAPAAVEPPLDNQTTDGAAEIGNVPPPGGDPGVEPVTKPDEEPKPEPETAPEPTPEAAREDAPKPADAPVDKPNDEPKPPSVARSFNDPKPTPVDATAPDTTMAPAQPRSADSKDLTLGSGASPAELLAAQQAHDQRLDELRAAPTVDPAAIDSANAEFYQQHPIWVNPEDQLTYQATFDSATGQVTYRRDEYHETGDQVLNDDGRPTGQPVTHADGRPVESRERSIKRENTFVTDRSGVRSGFAQTYSPDGAPLRTIKEQRPADDDALTTREYTSWKPDGSVDQRFSEQYHPTKDGLAALQPRAIESAFRGTDPNADAVGAWRFHRLGPNDVVNGTNPIEYRRNGDNIYEATPKAAPDHKLEPPKPGTPGKPELTIPDSFASTPSATEIDAAAPPADQLLVAQRAYESQLAAVSDPSRRNDISTQYFADNKYYVRQGPNGPTVFAATYAPQTDPALSHVVLTRRGEVVVDEASAAKTNEDVLQYLYNDGVSDTTKRSTLIDAPPGVASKVLTGEHANADGFVTSRSTYGESTVPRADQGLSPFTTTTASEERYDPATGKPVGEQRQDVATSDDTITTLQTRRKVYDARGVLRDEFVDNVEESRRFDKTTTESFVNQNQQIISAARAKDGFHPDNLETVTVPPVGTSRVEQHLNIHYNEDGVAVQQTSSQLGTAVQPTGEWGPNGQNGVRVVTSETKTVIGDGSGPIFDPATGTPIAPQRVKTDTWTNEFDPDAGRAGSDDRFGHQARQSTHLVQGATVHPDGRTERWATPFTSQTFREGFDDDWSFRERQYETNPDTGSIVLTAEGDPTEVDDGDEVTNASGEKVRASGVEVDQKSVDFADEFDDWWDDWGAPVVSAATTAAAIGGAVFTNGASIALFALAGGLSTVSAVGTQLNYSQEEASLLDRNIALASIPLSIFPAVGQLRVARNAGQAVPGASVFERGLVTAGNTSNAALTGYYTWDAAQRGDIRGLSAGLVGAYAGSTALKARGTRVARLNESRAQNGLPPLPTPAVPFTGRPDPRLATPRGLENLENRTSQFEELHDLDYQAYLRYLTYQSYGRA